VKNRRRARSAAILALRREAIENVGACRERSTYRAAPRPIMSA
jgi:hypothetical protein